MLTPARDHAGAPAPATPPTTSPRALPAVVAGVVAGACWALAAPPRGWWWLAVLGVAALALGLRGQGWRARALVGAATGAVYYGPALAFVTDFSPPGYLVLVLLQVAALAVACALVPAGDPTRLPPRRDERARQPASWRGRWAAGWARVRTRGTAVDWRGRGWALVPALVVLEAAQARAPFGGFPLTSLALSQVDGPLAAAAPLGGPLLITALTAATGVALATLVPPTRALVRAPMRTGALAPRPAAVQALGAGLALVAVAGVLAAGTLAAGVSTRTAGSVDVAVVQGGGQRGIAAVYTDPYDVTRRHLALARQITGTSQAGQAGSSARSAPSVDLVLLPENVVDVEGSIGASAVDARVAALAQDLGAVVVAGVTERTEEAFRNAAIAWDATGTRVGRYEKEHRVPFGEYLPARDLIERLSENAALVPRDAIEGQGLAVLETPVARAAVVISYEVFFPERVREGVAAGGQVVLVPTNASSYVTEQVPALQVATARLRAKESGRVLLQAGPTGYSAVIAPDGRVLARTQLEAAAVLQDRVVLRTGLTPYTATGDAPVLIAAVLVLVLAALAPRGRRGRARRPTRLIPSRAVGR